MVRAIDPRTGVTPSFPPFHSLLLRSSNSLMFANGGWARAHPLPADYSRWGTFMLLGKRNHQRRLAIGANLSGETTGGSSWAIRMVSVHLENRAKWSEVFHSFGRARLRQVKALVEACSTATPTIVGGDFNTWSNEWTEPAIRYME